MVLAPGGDASWVAISVSHKEIPESLMDCSVLRTVGSGGLTNIF